MATKRTITKYNPSMCQVMIDMGMEGASQKMIWSQLGISKSTAESWKKKYPDFAEALELSRVHSQAYWEREILANVNNKGFNSRIAEIALRGQFQEDYRETRDNKVDAKVDVVIDFNGAVSDLIKQLKEAK
jgi:transposase